MRQTLLTTFFIAAFVAAPAAAWAQEPEIDRDPAAPQATGAVHTLRTITEACTRLEGVFTGEADPPYAVRAVASAPGCQPRARFDEDATADAGEGWVLNDRIIVPSTACPSQSAVVEVWRLPGTAAPPELDAQGRARIYLDESRKEGASAAAPPRFTATLTVDGQECRAQ